MNFLERRTSIDGASGGGRYPVPAANMQADK